MEKLRFLTPDAVKRIKEKFGTPIYVYDKRILIENAESALAFPNAFGLTVRFAMKASSNAAILKLLTKMGVHIDASSGFEVLRALNAKVPASHISLSSQEMPDDFESIYRLGIQFNACSLAQLEKFGRLFPGEKIGIRINPGLGSGHTGKTNVGGPHSSFGIWHEWADKALAICGKYDLTPVRLHSHIGSGSDPAVWERVARLNIEALRKYKTATILNLGGGFKVGRMSYEKSTDLKTAGAPIKEALLKFHEETGRKMHLEIEPGTFLLANAAAIVATIQDVVETGGKDGMKFLKLDTGMTEILRPTLYAAQHPIIVVPRKETAETETYMVVGHCCESGDVLTTGTDNPETLMPRKLSKASIGDLCVIEGAGAYCSSLCAKNYNSFPEAPEAMMLENGEAVLIRKRQKPEQIWQNEVDRDIDI